MPQGDKRKYTAKQIRKADHIEEGYKEQGLSEDEAERRAWATVNKIHKGGEKPGGGGYGKPEDHSAGRKGGRKAAKKRAAKGRKTTGTRKAAGARKTTRKSDGARKSGTRKAAGRKTAARTRARGGRTGAKKR